MGGSLILEDTELWNLANFPQIEEAAQMSSETF